jgi:hypothetical protein
VSRHQPFVAVGEAIPVPLPESKHYAWWYHMTWLITGKYPGDDYLRAIHELAAIGMTPADLRKENEQEVYELTNGDGLDFVI